MKEAQAQVGDFCERPPAGPLGLRVSLQRVLHPHVPEQKHAVAGGPEGRGDNSRQNQSEHASEGKDDGARDAELQVQLLGRLPHNIHTRHIDQHHVEVHGLRVGHQLGGHVVPRDLLHRGHSRPVALPASVGVAAAVARDELPRHRPEGVQHVAGVPRHQPNEQAVRAPHLHWLVPRGGREHLALRGENEQEGVHLGLLGHLLQDILDADRGIGVANDGASADPDGDGAESALWRPRRAHQREEHLLV
mmetsp:Transcript_68661/g.182415  ORF Transcript_68661/g.182415 Transcript_68661/m.182415 type:complete len:248 (+) Transcript_68661:635-1378(+)